MKKENRNKWYGWSPDLPDSRDKLYRVEKTAEVASVEQLPAAVDLRSKCPPVYDQGALGSCTANAIAGNIGFIEAGFVASRLFIYYNERRMEGTVKTDSGAQIRDGIKSVASDGTCPESMWPYNIGKFASKPWCWCYKNAAKDKVVQYLRVNGLQEIKSCLAAGFPVIFGFTVYESFESQKVASTGILDMPGANESAVGGHAVLCVGYDDISQRVIVRNSWGADWGIQGYFTMPYAYISNPSLADDMWTIRK